MPANRFALTRRHALSAAAGALMALSIAAQITEAAVAAQFAARRPSAVRRYLLPKLHAINFVLDGVLDGGVNDALNLDSHGKALSFLLLDLPVQVPAALVQHLAGPR